MLFSIELDSKLPTSGASSKSMDVEKLFGVYGGVIFWLFSDATNWRCPEMGIPRGIFHLNGIFHLWKPPFGDLWIIYPLVICEAIDGPCRPVSWFADLKDGEFPCGHHGIWMICPSNVHEFSKFLLNFSDVHAMLHIPCAMLHIPWKNGSSHRLAMTPDDGDFWGGAAPQKKH